MHLVKLLKAVLNTQPVSGKATNDLTFRILFHRILLTVKYLNLIGWNKVGIKAQQLHFLMMIDIMAEKLPLLHQLFQCQYEPFNTSQPDTDFASLYSKMSSLSRIITIC